MLADVLVGECAPQQRKKAQEVLVTLDTRRKAGCGTMPPMVDGFYKFWDAPRRSSDDGLSSRRRPLTAPLNYRGADDPPRRCVWARLAMDDFAEWNHILYIRREHGLQQACGLRSGVRACAESSACF